MQLFMSCRLWKVVIYHILAKFWNDFVNKFNTMGSDIKGFGYPKEKRCTHTQSSYFDKLPPTVTNNAVKKIFRRVNDLIPVLIIKCYLISYLIVACIVMLLLVSYCVLKSYIFLITSSSKKVNP